MIFYVIGDLFESPAQTLVNTVNTVGVMGKGIALGFKQRYPSMFEEYKHLCEDGVIQIGTLHVFRTPAKFILNFPTKENWRRPSKIEWIERGLQTFVAQYQEAGIHSVAFPPLGCGNGELRYDDVRPLMEQYLGNLPIPVYLYAPLPRHQPAEHRAPIETSRWLSSRPFDLAFNHVWLNDLRGLLATRRKFAKLGGRDTFEATWNEDGDRATIQIRAGRSVHTITPDSAKYLWRELIANALITSQGFPSEDSPYLLALLAELPYVRHFRIADAYEELQRRDAWGLRLIPPTANQPAARPVSGV